jgi:hypothetical protein
MSEDRTENAKTSVFDLTADLMMTTEESEPKQRGVDWGWGSDDEHKSMVESPHREADDPSKPKEEEADSDATAEMDSDDETEEEEDDQPALETQPPVITATKPREAGEEEDGASCEDPSDPDPKYDEEGTEKLGSQQLVLDKSSEDEISEEVSEEAEQHEKEPPLDEAKDSDDDRRPSTSENKDGSVPSSPAEIQPRKSGRVRRKTVVDSDSEPEEPVERRSQRQPRQAKRAPKRAEAPKDDNAADKDAEPTSEPSRQTRAKDRPSDEAPKEDPMDDEQKIDEEDLLRSTDFLFVNADKDSVTVADICHALSAEYDCKIPKAMRKLVRQRLVDLMKGNVTPQVAGGVDEPEEDDEDEQVSEQGDVESEHSDYEESPDSDEERKGASSKPRRAEKTKKPTTQAKTKALKPVTDRPSQRKAARAARMIEAEHRRKKRMEELRVRNEEMQLNQSKEEQERAEAIAAKFETNTDEFRLKRLEDRLTLLELLDKKRIAVIEALESKIEQKEAADASAEIEKESEDIEEAKTNTAGNSDEETDDSSSDEEELDIVGLVKPSKPLKFIHTHLPSKAVNFLKEFRSNQATKPEPSKINLTVTSPSSFMKSLASPTKKEKGARGSLRMALKRKVRKQGNLWLARELGYKTEEDHLKDCQQAADQKLSIVLKMEHARIEANERKLLRERILRQDEGIPGDEENADEAEVSVVEGEDNEEDEEMQLAKEIMKASEEADSEAEDVPDGSADGENFDTNDPKSGALEKTADGKEGSASLFQANNEEEESQYLDTQPLVPSESVVATKAEYTSHSKAASQESGESTEGQPTDEGAVTNLPVSCEQSDVTPTDSTSAFAEDDEGEVEFDEQEDEPKENLNRPRNAAWQAMLQKEAEKLKRQKKNRGQGLVEDQAEEEEEEEVAGLEDFGFSVKKKKQGDDDDDDDIHDDALDEDDLKHVVDDVSDNEGDEEAGDEARKKQERLEEKERHKEILRRMREGYDGRRGGIAGSGVGARGMHRFDQLVAADNREDAKRLGLLNDDELDSDDEGEKKEGKTDDNEEDEAALLDKILKDRFLHRTDVDLEENFSEDEEDPEEAVQRADGNDSEAEEERTQERLAKRFAKRARMQRLEEEFADSQEFSQQRLIDEDESMRQELSQMKNGLVRKRSISSGTRTSSISSHESRLSGQKRPLEMSTTGKALLDKSGGSLSIALRASRKPQRRTSFLGGDKVGKAKDSGAFIHRNVALSHVVFGSANPSTNSQGASNAGQKRKLAGPTTNSLFSKVRKAQ